MWSETLRLLPGYDPFRAPGDAWFDASLADRAIAFVEECIRHVEGDMAGKPFLLQPWQRSWVANLFGWQRFDAQGRQVRRYRESLLYVPRKNGKSPLVAAVALYVFFCDGEAGQQNYIAAGDREQAGMLFRQAKGMVEQEPELAGRCRIYGGNASAGQSRSIVRESDASFLRVISADADTKHGGNSHLVIIDELHTQPGRELVDVLSTSMASANRKQPLLISITTADFERPSICNEKHDYACKVRDGVIDDSAFLPAIWETKKDEDWRSPEVWRKANPNLGVSVSEEYLAREAKRAEENPAYQATFVRLHLNLKTETSTRAVDMIRWDQAPHLDVDSLDGLPCWVGLDLSSTTDLTALVLLFRVEEEPPAYAVLPHLYSPRATARKRTRTDRVPYEAWAAQGFLTLTEGEVVDYDRIRLDLQKLGERYQILEVAADRWNATHLIQQIQGDGVRVVAFGQGFQSMTAPTKELLAVVSAGRLLHGGHPVLRWMASNLAVDQDAAGNLKPAKNRSADRIDGMVALIMALGRAMQAACGTASVYDTRGLEVL